MSNKIDDAAIQEFCAITSLSVDRARFFVEAANGDVSLAVSQYFENQGGQDFDDDDLYQQDEEETPIRQPQATSQKNLSSNKQTAGKSNDKKMFTLSDLGGGGEDNDSEDGEEGQAFYAGGSETSGQQILGPPKRDPNKMIKEMFKKARDMGAEEIPELSDKPEKPYHSVGGYRLGDGSGPSEKVAGASSQMKKKQVRTLKLWKNGFNIDDGPLRSYEDRKNMEFLNSVQNGITPDELIKEAQGGEVHLEMQDHREEELIPPKPAYVLFNEAGHKLGSPAPRIVSNTAPETAKKNEDNASKVLKVDESQPKTQIRLTLTDGTKLNVSANHSHRVSDLRNYLITARPEYNAHRFLFSTSFPKKDLNDESKTLKEENLLNSVLMVKII